MATSCASRGAFCARPSSPRPSDLPARSPTSGSPTNSAPDIPRLRREIPLIVCVAALLCGCTGRIGGTTSDGTQVAWGDAGSAGSDGAASTVTARWSAPLSQLGKIHALTVAPSDDVLYVSSDTGLHLVQTKGQGELRCSVLTGSNDVSAPVKSQVTLAPGGNVYFTRASQRCLGAIGNQGCEQRWGSAGEGYFDCLAASDTTPVLVDGSDKLLFATVADGSGTAHVWVVSTAKGTEVLHKQLKDHDVRRSLAAGDGDTVFLGTQVSGTGKLYRLAPPDYDPQELLAANKIAAPPLYAGGSVLVGDWGGVLHAVDATSGTKSWQLAAGSTAIFSAPVQLGSQFLVAVSLDGLHATAAGKESWSFPLTTIQFSGVAVDSNGTAYVGSMAGCSGGSGGCVLAIRDGQLRWKFETDAGVNATPAVLGDTVYAGTQTGTVYAIAK